MPPLNEGNDQLLTILLNLQNQFTDHMAQVEGMSRDLKRLEKIVYGVLLAVAAVVAKNLLGE